MTLSHTRSQRTYDHRLRDLVRTVGDPEIVAEFGVPRSTAQRLGRVFAAPATWYRLVRERGWRRPRTRVHPAKPKDGVPASKPDELWHIDMTVIRLLDGTKVYLYAVIDNFSRRILAWRVTENFSVATTVAIVHAANRGAATRHAGRRCGCRER